MCAPKQLPAPKLPSSADWLIEKLHHFLRYKSGFFILKLPAANSCRRLKFAQIHPRKPCLSHRISVTMTTLLNTAVPAYEHLRQKPV
jgi:hypothetical protein